MLTFTPQGRYTLIFLASVVLFLLGVATGRSVNNVDKKLQSSGKPLNITSLSPTSSAPITPTQPQQSYRVIEECDTTILLPSSFTKTHSKPPRYAQGDSFVDIDCLGLLELKENSPTLNKENSPTLKNGNVIWTVQLPTVTITKQASKSATTRSSVTFHATPDIAPLVKRTLQFDAL